MKRNFWQHGFALACLATLSACGGGGGGGMGEMKVSITDAPVDNAKEVVITISGIDVKPKGDGPAIKFPLAVPLRRNLLEFTDGVAFVALPPVDLPAGEYEWLRLNIIDTTLDDAHVLLNDESVHSLKVPSDTLRLIRGFTVPEDGIVSLIVDFDLRKSLVERSGGYNFKPVLRVVDEDRAGLISGTVANSLVTAADCPAALPTATDSAGRVVYVYAGSNAIPDDIDTTDPQPVVSSFVRPDGAGGYRYTVAYLPVGDYTVAFTCHGDSDNPETDDPTVVFSAQGNATVTADGNTPLNLPVPPPAP
ncbi:MAG TPA: DUF4382 domain-containing protein [Solimonas sp.]|nr:DUF4382 domain-containing protein [Solimonas sp.]